MMRTLLTLLACVLSIFINAQADCDNAQIVDEGVHTSGAISGVEPPVICPPSSGGAGSGNWFVYTPTDDYSLTITTELAQNAGQNLDTRFHVYLGSSCADFVCVGGNDDTFAFDNGFLSRDTFNVNLGSTYYIVFDNRWDGSGFDFELIEGNPIVEPPPTPVTFSVQGISTSGLDIGVVDMNNDGLDDAVSVESNNLNIHFQQSGGGFLERDIATPNADYFPEWSLAAGDYDKNGYNDLLYGSGTGVTFMKATVDPNNIDNGDPFDDVTGYVEISTSEDVFSQRSNFVDINNDGNLDAFVCHDLKPNVYYINDGSGNLTFNQGGLGDFSSGGNYGSIWIDYDNDRDLDLFISKCGGSIARRTNQMFTNDGSENYSENAAAIGLDDPIQTWSSAFGDFDNDGDLDVFVGANEGSHKLMENDNGTFTDVTADSGISALTANSIETVSFDLDNDGNLDVISGGNVLIGNGDLTFFVYENLLPLDGSAYGDLNNDGFIDAFNLNLYLNNANDNNWIKIITKGVASNSNGIGARVELYTPSGTQIRDVVSGSGFEFMSTLNTHFGLGTETTIDSIVIYWPSGTIDTIANPAINSTITIIEGDSLNIADEALSDLSLHPNPVEDVLNITSSSSVTGYVATVFDVNGKRVLNSKLTSDQLDVSSLLSGVYFLRLEARGKSIKRKFIKE